MTGLHNLKRAQVIRAFERLGWYIARDAGKHTILKHPRRPGIVPIPRHRVVASGTMREILKEAGLTWDQFIEAYDA
jgi:predicted RNA binding protein YcfA (HicA-like mRNA interferase family)